MLPLREIVDGLFSCLGPLRVCQEPIQDRCVDPLQDRLIDPINQECVDPLRRALEVNPLGCLPWAGQPSLPQFDSVGQQESRAAQLARTRPQYQYNYTLVRTFQVEERD